MTPASLALVEFVEALAGEPTCPADVRARLAELCREARGEDPLTVAADRALAGFRKGR